MSFIGILNVPKLAMLWAALLRVGSGAPTFIGLRTKNAGDAAALSGMAQSVGYLMAAMVPLLPGKVHELSGGWTLPLLMTAAIAVVGACTGIAAGRNAHLEPVQQPY